jgi:hypothetical protein
MRNLYKILVGKPEVKRTLGRTRRRWEVAFRMDLRDMWWEDVDWIHPAQGRDHWQTPVNTVMKFGVP